MQMVEVRDLVKKYASPNGGDNSVFRGVNGLSFDVPRGEIFGIIGPDGAGKTTLFRILTTLILADGGTVFVNGMDVVKDYRKIRSCVGYMPGRFSLYQDLTVEENLTFFASVFKTTLEKNYSLIKDIYQQIEPFKDRSAGKLSGGMKQKLALCCALIHKPEVLFLDEPTTGVDPVSRKEFWEMLQELKKQGLTILASTPYMDEATLCDRIALIREGRFIGTDTPGHIIEGFGEMLWAVRSDRMYQLLKDLREYPAIKSCFAFGDVHHVTSTLSAEDFEPEIRVYLKNKGHSGVLMDKIDAGIEDCYMKLEKGGK